MPATRGSPVAVRRAGVSTMSSRVRIVAVVFSLMAGASALLRADWTAVGSTGTIDEGDVGKVVLNNDGSASIRSSISSTSAKVRFNVTSNEGIDFFIPKPGEETGNLLFTMRVRDNGTGARVLATLKRITLGGGSDISMPQSTVIAATIDSDLSPLPPSNDWTTVWAQHYNRSAFAGNITTGDSMDFLRFGWVVEVQLIKHDATGNPGIMGVQIFRDQP